MVLSETVSAATPWLDSLYVRVADAGVQRTGGNAVVVFDLEVFRPVKVWNNNDTTLGTSDFVFGKPSKDLTTIFKDVQVRPLHDAIKLNQSAALRLEGRFVLGKLQISLTDLENGASRLKLPYREWVKLCRVELPLINPATVELGLVWDATSTGLITRNIPILEVLKDDLDRIPDKILNFEEYSSSQTICSGEEFFLFAHAISSGKGLNCTWQYSVDKGGAYKDLSSTATNWNNVSDGFQYWVSGEYSDTLWLKNLTMDLNGIIFRCVAEDPTVSSEKRETPNMTVTIWPEIQVALEGYASAMDYQAGIGKAADTIRHCPGENGFARVAFYGIHNNTQVNNLKRMGNVYVVYHWVNDLGSDGRDTLKVDLASLSFQNFSWNSSYVLTAEKLQLQLPEDGKYYIHKVWTDSCSVGTVLTAYDTVFLRSNANVVLEFDPIEYVAGSGDIDVTEGLGMQFSAIQLRTPSVGNILGNYYEAPAGKVGTDTLLYSYASGGCTVTATRLVNVSSSKHVAIKVLLEGPYIAKADSMRCLAINNFSKVGGKLVSPYADKKECITLPMFNHRIADWIYVEVWDYPPNGKTMDDTKCGRLVDSTSALLLSDGTIAGLDGNKYVSFNHLKNNDYYVLIRHRNHLPILSAKPIIFTAGAIADVNTLDFTQKMENAFDISGSATQQPPLKSLSGKCVMYSGHISGLGRIGVNDIKRVLLNLSQSGYLSEDLNFDGRVNGTDKKIVNNNLSILIKY